MKMTFKFSSKKIRGINMKKYLPYLLFTSIIFTFTLMVSRSFRVGQIPNGSALQCASCHVSPGGGGARTEFGETVRASFLTSPSGNVIWGPELAAIDSDGDGFTNGEELQDPNGEWTGGAIGDPSLVTNPGDASSFPNPTSVENIGEIVSTYKLNRNYPNPFNPTTNISFNLAEASDVRIDIYNSLGQLVNTIVNNSYGPGSFNAKWDATDQYGSKVTSGMYIYRMTATSEFTDKQFVDSKRMLLVK
jgi:hypothetical protein